MWIKRLWEKEISKRDAHSLLLGPRQVGKSSLLAKALGIPSEEWLGNRQEQENPYVVYNLLRDEEYLRLTRSPELLRQEVLAAAKKHPRLTVILDEVQRIPALLNEVQSLIDFYKRSKIRFFLTGSSARKLKRGGANLLPGRVIIHKISPLVYTEWKDHFTLEQVLRLGSLPGILTASPEHQWDLLKGYVNIYLKEEIQAEGITRGLGPFSRFIELAASSSGKQVNFSSLSRDAGVPYSTIRQYFQILEDTLVGILLPPYTGKTAKRLSMHPKFYFFDLGVRNALINLRFTGLPATILGDLFENFVILEFLRRADYFALDAHFFFWRTHAGAEVDCVMEVAGQLYAFEMKAKKQIHASDVTGLTALRETYGNKVKRLFVISFAERATTIGQVEVLPWQKALTLDFSSFF